MSQAAPYGLAMPRWSAAGQAATSPASMAGLPDNNAIVWVNPPLSSRGPSFGFVLLRLPALVKLQLPSELRLWPASVTAPKQLLLALAPMMVLRNKVSAPVEV